MGKWSKLKKENKRVTLPTRDSDGEPVEVVLREPDIVTAMMTGQISLPDSFFAMFATSTEEGEQDETAMLKQLSDNPEAGEGLLDFLNVLAKAAFVEPKLVDNEEDADWETTVPISAFTMVDKMFVMQQFPEMFNQLAGLQTFRPEANGAVQPVSESE